MAEAGDGGLSSARALRFHGPVMVAVATLMAAASMPGQSILVALFNDPIRADLGISIAAISLCYTIGTVSAALPLPLVGRLADRYGLRVVVGGVTLAFAGGLWLLSRAGDAVWLTLGFFLIRLFGQGSLGMLAGHALAMWYERKLGRVSSIKMLGFNVGGAVLPAPTVWLIAAFGWRPALVVLACFVLALVMPCVLTVFRNRPEDLGQHLDGDPAEHETHDTLHGGAPPPGDPAFTLAGALATRAFWILTLCVAVLGVIGTAGLFHMQPMLESAGADPEDAAKAVAPFPLASLAGVLLGGWLIDFVRARWLLPLGPMLTCLASLALFAAVSEAFDVPPVATMGLGMGLFGLAQGFAIAAATPTMARYFGRTHHGAIRGAQGTAMVAATGLGPIAAGGAYELFDGSFTQVLLVFAAACVPLTIAGFTLRRPTPAR